MAVADLIQHNCQDGKTARLTIRAGNQQAMLYFANGQVVHASLGDLQGEEAVYRVLGWEDGEFNLETGIQPPARTIDQSWNGLLMEGARRLDESNIREQTNIEEENPMAGELDTVLMTLKNELPGFIAASVVGMDGLGIAGYSDKTINIENINAQMTLLFKLVNTTVERLNAGTVEDFLLTTERAYLLIRYLSNGEYYLGISVDRQKANLGNLRLMSRIYAGRIDKIMPH